MKSICIKSFYDNGVLVSIGDSVDFSEARTKALASIGYLKAEEEPKKVRRTKRGE